MIRFYYNIDMGIYAYVYKKKLFIKNYYFKNYKVFML
jgi:hypothetical protein